MIDDKDWLGLAAALAGDRNDTAIALAMVAAAESFRSMAEETRALRVAVEQLGEVLYASSR